MMIVVPSCKAYGDSWEPFARFMERHWPDRPWPVMLGTDRIEGSSKPKGFDLVNVLCHDSNWCMNLIEHLEKMCDETILLIMEDFWIDDFVDTDFIKDANSVVQDNDHIGCFRLYPAPPANGKLQNIGHQRYYGEIKKGTRYRVSAAQSIWRRKFLMRLLDGKKDAWDFEIKGTEQAENMPEVILSVPESYRPLKCIYTAITRGQWEPGALKRAEQLGIEVDTSRREIRQDV